MKNLITAILIFAFAALLSVGLFLIQAWLVQTLLNFLFAAPFTAGIDYTAACALLLLCRTLFTGNLSIKKG